MVVRRSTWPMAWHDAGRVTPGRLWRNVRGGWQSGPNSLLPLSIFDGVGV